MRETVTESVCLFPYLQAEGRGEHFRLSLFPIGFAYIFLKQNMKENRTTPNESKHKDSLYSMDSTKNEPRRIAKSNRANRNGGTSDDLQMDDGA